MMRHKDLRDEFDSLHLLAKNLLVPLPPGKISSPIGYSPPPPPPPPPYIKTSLH